MSKHFSVTQVLEYLITSSALKTKTAYSFANLPQISKCDIPEDNNFHFHYIFVWNFQNLLPSATIVSTRVGHFLRVFTSHLGSSFEIETEYFKLQMGF
jgi:hypothetical protein